MRDPIERIREMHRKAPGNHAVLSLLSEVLSKQEIALVASYALGLIEGRSSTGGRSKAQGFIAGMR
jgi:phosphoenolpyruvate carboxylase